MSVLAKISSFIGGNLFKEVKDLVQDYFPPDMDPLQKAELQIRLNEISSQKEIQANKLLIEAESALTQRIVQLEGSAQDLRAIPYVGPLVIFLRGLQRPIWGYSVLWIDIMWFSGKWTLADQQESAMWIINLLVLGFLFGERAVQNVAPLISELINKRDK